MQSLHGFESDPPSRANALPWQATQRYLRQPQNSPRWQYAAARIHLHLPSKRGRYQWLTNLQNPSYAHDCKSKQMAMPCSQHCAAQRQALRKLPLLASMCFILHSEYLLHTWIQTLGSVGAHARLLRGGPDSQNVFCVASGCTHLGEPPQAGPGVAARLRCSAPVRVAGANVVGGGRAVMSVSLCACACPEACSGASTREYEPCAPSRAGIAPCQRCRTPVCIPLSAP